jgi:hypothetical protein
MAGFEVADGSPVDEGAGWLRRAVSDASAPKLNPKGPGARIKSSTPTAGAVAGKKGRVSKPYITVEWQEDGRGGFAKSADGKPAVKSRLVIGNFRVVSQDHVPPPPPYLTCGSWVILDGATKRCIAEFNAREVRGMASLTKMMTCAVVLRLACAQPELLQMQVVVTRHAVDIGRLGTTAALRLGEVLTVSDLLYAMMLPSGNDAASLLAQALGPHIQILRCDRPKLLTRFWL